MGLKYPRHVESTNILFLGSGQEMGFTVGVCTLVRDNSLTQQLDAITKAVLLCLVARFRKCRSTLQNRKDRLAQLIKDFMGEDILREIQERPAWHNDMQVTRERLTSRWERSTT